MTREEAIKIFNEVLLFGKAPCTQAEFEELAKMSIQALEQEPILDRIRAEIMQVANEEKFHDAKWALGLRYAANIIDKYKAESEPQESEG